MSRPVWAGSATFRLGPDVVHVRSTSSWLHQTLTAALRAHIAADDHQPSATYSIQPADGGGDGSVLGLYQGSCLVARSRDHQCLLWALVARLAAHAVPPELPAQVRVDALALVGHGFAVLGPREIRCQVALLERRLQSAGWSVVHAPWALVDVDACVALVPTVGLAIECGETRQDPAPGRYPLAGWIFAAGEPIVSRAPAAASAAGLVLDRRELEGRLIDSVAALLDRVQVRAVAPEAAPELAGPLLATLTELGGRPGRPPTDSARPA